MPAGKTYVKIASQTLGSDTATVTFSNLPQNYTDLIIVGTKQANNNGSFTPSPALRFNEDTGSNYSSTLLDGNGTAASSNRYTSGTRLLLGYAIGIGLNSDAIVIWQIQNYSNSTTYKTVLGRLNNPTTGTAPGTGVGVGLWRSTAAITSITLSPQDKTWSSGAGFTIYGIECAKSPYAEGGDKVYSTGTHWVHEFYNSGQFVPRQNLTADYLVVAGGGGGGGSYGGGGGAGGLRSTVTATGGGGSLESALSLTASTAYTVTIGAGGIGATGDNATTGVGQGSDGSNSVFSTITATGGGGGGQEQISSGNGRTGGSGGGGGGQGGGSNTGGARTASPVQGFNGGNGFGQGGVGPGGGGGGAGAVGANGTTSTAGSGGAGATVAITGSSITYAGGGGGGIITGTAGSGGSGGGGAGSSTGNGTSGTANTGGGGGGADNNFTGGNGGSGIVIVRYAV